jgi:threonine/homoserine/homoserine lactone efflux protein
MDIRLLLKGLLVGLSIAAPVGPIGVLCIRRTLADGRAVGFVSGLGAATADAVYGWLAAFGVSVVASFLVGQQAWLRLIGGLLLCALGIKTLLTRPAERPADAQATGLLGAYASTFLLTLTNPMTILSFAAVFASLGLGETPHDHASAAMVIAGVFTGSALWWLTLSGGVSLLHGRITAQGLTWINRVSGLIISGFGLLAIWGAV